MPPNALSLATTTTVVASPALAAETIIAQITGLTVDAPSRRIELLGWCAFTVGTSGTAVRLRLRQSTVSGTLVADTGALTGGVAAAGLLSPSIAGLDAPGDVTTFVYVMTLQVTAGAAPSTVSAVYLRGLIVQ